MGREQLDKVAPYLPWAGLLLIIVGLIVTYANNGFEIVNNLLLGGGVILLLLYVMLRPDEVRILLSGREARYGGSAALSTLFLAAIFIFGYWIVFQNEEWRYDVTETGEFTPLPELVTLLTGTETEIEALAFFSAAQFNRDNTEEYLTALSAEADNFSFDFIDPNVEPLVAQQYNVTNDGTIIFVQNRGGVDERTAEVFFINDRDVYAALLQLINPTEKIAYFLTGHGEPVLTDTDVTGLNLAVGLIEDLGFTAVPLDLRVGSTVPADADVVVLISPARPLEPEEMAGLAAYADSGGALFIARDVVSDETRALAEEDGLAGYLAQNWGVAFRPDLIVDAEQAQLSQSLAFVAQDFGQSVIVSADLREFLMLFDIARSVALSPLEGLVQTELVRSSPQAWGETEFGLANTQFDEGVDTAGPLVIAASVENMETGGRLVVVGDGDFIINNNAFSGGNSVFFTNSLNWLARDEVTLELTPRETVDRSLSMTGEQVALMQVIGTCLGPLILAVLGFGMWRRRRNQR